MGEHMVILAGKILPEIAPPDMCLMAALPMVAVYQKTRGFLMGYLKMNNSTWFLMSRTCLELVILAITDHMKI